jgi:hypothetical protein
MDRISISVYVFERMAYRRRTKEREPKQEDVAGAACQQSGKSVNPAKHPCFPFEGKLVQCRAS